MSKAEEQALKAYPRENDDWDDCNVYRRIAYKIGYKQAEQDLMADAIETTIDGDKVKIIIIKD